MKKLLLLVMALAIALNCGMAFAETEEEVSGDLSIYLWDNEYAALAVVEAYQEKYPNVNVELNVTPFMDYQTKLFTSLAGGGNDGYIIHA